MTRGRRAIPVYILWAPGSQRALIAVGLRSGRWASLRLCAEDQVGQLVALRLGEHDVAQKLEQSADMVAEGSLGAGRAVVEESFQQIKRRDDALLQRVSRHAAIGFES